MQRVEKGQGIGKIFRAGLVVWVCLFAAQPSRAHAEPSSRRAPTYPEIGGGTSSFWIDAGPAGWTSDRAPLASRTPTSIGFGYAHRIDTVRLAWRAHLLTGASDDRPLRFVYVDFVSVERVWRGGIIEPYYRFAVGFGLDLKGANRDLGSAGYFNAGNGAAGGIGLAHGWGIDWRLGASFFLKTEADVRAYGGVGRSGLLLSARGGAGFSF